MPTGQLTLASTCGEVPAKSTWSSSPANRVPALVWVHGGPGGQSRHGYGADIQHLVNHGYAGRIVPIRPRAGVVQGLAAYASIKDAPDKVDVAVIVVPAEQAVAASGGNSRRISTGQS